MEKMRKMAPYLLVVIFAFYLLPFLIKDTGSGLFVLLILIPALCLTTSMIYGVKNPFHWRYPLMIMGLFIPTLFIFYNTSAAIYIPIYGMISFAGSFLGNLIQNIYKGNQRPTRRDE